MKEKKNMLKSDITDIKKILVRAPNWIGDAVLCLPSLEALEAVYPQAEITVLAKPWASPVFYNNPFVKKIIEYDRAGQYNGVFGELRLVQDIKKDCFDMAVLFQNAFKAALIAYMAGIPIRAGYSRNLRGLLLTHPIRFDVDIKKAHQVFYYLNIVTDLSKGLKHDKGVLRPAFGIQPKIYLTKEEKDWAAGFLSGKGIGSGAIIGIAPGASYGPAKRWMAERFKEVAERLVKDNGARVVLFGGKDDRGVCSAVLDGLTGLNLAGEIDMRKSIALINRCNLFITNDSGPMHIAAALGIPTAAIFGSTDPNLTRPLGDNVMVIKKHSECSPCFDRECRYGHYNCMELITADDVYDVAKELLVARGQKLEDNSLRSIAVFLDRDGTINEDTGYIDSPDRLVLISGASSAIKELNLKGLRTVVITNQSGVGRGYFSKEALDTVNKRLEWLIKKQGAHLDAIYYCPHHPDDNCECRKPATGLLEKAKRDFNIDFKKSYVVGDKASDVEIANNIGCKGILVLTGMGKDEKKKLKSAPSYIADDLKDAVEWIIKDRDACA